MKKPRLLKQCQYIITEIESVAQAYPNDQGVEECRNVFFDLRD